MGIGAKSESLWSLVKSCEREVDISDISSIISTDSKHVRIAVDFSIVLIAAASVVWAKMFKPTDNESWSSGLQRYSKVNDDKAIIQGIKEIMYAKNAQFLKNNLLPIWCMEGDFNNKKLATVNRKSKRQEKKEKIIEIYCKLKSACENLAKTRDHLENFSFIEEHMGNYVYVEKGTVNNIGELFSELKKLLSYPDNGFLKSSILNEVRHYFQNDKSFMCFKVPEIAEAEKTAAILTNIGFCHAVMTTDSDALVLGAKYIFFKKRRMANDDDEDNNSTRYSLYCYNEVASVLGIQTVTCFLALAMILGTDFSERICPMKTTQKNHPIVFTRCTDREITDYIYNLNLLNCGAIKPDSCLEMLGITENDKLIVRKKFIETFY